MYHKTLEAELEILKTSRLFRALRRVDSDQSSRIIIDEREYINLCSNNYLGLANHQALKDASIDAIREYGNSAAASRLISGNMELHEKLERITAEFKETESALIFNTGYMANVGTLQALTGETFISPLPSPTPTLSHPLQGGGKKGGGEGWLRGEFSGERDAIFSDALNHASIIDGCRLSRAKVYIYNHRDAEHLRRLLSKAPGYRRRIVITDSVFSMDGDISPLPDIVKVSEEYDATLIVDDAHATGVLGERGRGSFEHFGIKKVDAIQMGTYSKALGSFGAYVAGSKTVRDYLINKARPFIFTTALPPSVTAASIAAIKILREDGDRLGRLWENTRLFREGLEGIGFNILNSETPIIPVLIGDIEKTILFSERLFEDGIYAVPIRPPTVPGGGSRIRTTVTASHAVSDIEFCINVFEKVGKELRVI